MSAAMRDTTVDSAAVYDALAPIYDAMGGARPLRDA